MLVSPSLPSAPNTIIDNRQAKIQAVHNALNGPYNSEIWDPTEREEHRRNFNKLIAQNSSPKDVILKAPGSPAFIRWDQDGFSKAKDLDTTKGYFSQDTQYIQNFTVSDEHGHLPQTLQSQASDNREAANYHYRFADEPTVQIARQEALTPSGVRETFTVQNPDDVPHAVSINLGTGFRDFFQIRAGADEKFAPFKPRLRQQLIDRDNTRIDATTATFAQSGQIPDRFSLMETHHENLPIRQQTQLNPSQDTALSRWVMDVPPHTENGVFSIDLNTQNALANQAVSHASSENYVKANMAMPSIQVETSPDASGQAIQHLQHTLDVSAKDLQMMTLPISNPNPKNGLGATFTPTSAGIPNFVALFGRDSLITALFSLQFQPEYAKQALLALAAYQGKKTDPSNEEEAGKIMHEVRQGELTRLGHTPQRPSYSTLDATPLFVILYDAYVQRTGDTALAEALKPNVRAALGWIENNTQGNDAGFLTQRNGKKNGTDLKNIGWKDSQYSLRHRVVDGKLTDPSYPVAPAEVQAQVQQAWQAGARAFPEKAADYTARAEKLKQGFQTYWQPQQQWVASAMDAEGKPVASVASNGAQALWGDVLTPEQAQQIQARALQPDLLSGWGMRTLSSKEAAYNPISYHNGTIWPHDNALIAMGAKRNQCDALTQMVSDQVLQAARLFPENRLPELYAGLPRQDMAGTKDTTILEYPETCTVQAWASAAPYAFLTSLLGLDIRTTQNGQPQIHFKNPSLPTGVNSLRIKGVPVSAGNSMDILARRDVANQKVNVWLKPSNPFSQWTPYQE